MDPYSDYDDFAQFYNRHWGSFALAVLPILERLALNDYPAGAAILDLCCGTGQLAGELTARGYTVTGVDGSEQMLKHACQNAPDANFVCSDARAFDLQADFAMAFSTYDSLNHLLTLDDLALVFRSVFRHLQAGGVFVFDMNLEAGFRSRWRGAFNIVSATSVVVVNSKYDDAEKLATMDMTLFAQDEAQKSRWRRSDLTLTQRAYSLDDLTATLAMAGFDRIEVFDARQDLSLRDEGRAFFRAMKL